MPRSRRRVRLLPLLLAGALGGCITYRETFYQPEAAGARRVQLGGGQVAGPRHHLEFRDHGLVTHVWMHEARRLLVSWQVPDGATLRLDGTTAAWAPTAAGPWTPLPLGPVDVVDYTTAPDGAVRLPPRFLTQAPDAAMTGRVYDRERAHPVLRRLFSSDAAFAPGLPDDVFVRLPDALLDDTRLRYAPIHFRKRQGRVLVGIQ